MSMHFSLLFMILVLAFLMGCALSQAQGLNTSYQPSFQDDDKADFILNNSYIVLNAIQVTPDVSNGALIVNMSGRALYGKQFKLWSENKGITRASFNSTFVINISPQTVPGGEGLAFIIAADHNLPQNSEGQWLGIVNAETNGSGTANIVAVEFDTRKSYTEDLDDNHVGLDVNSINSIKQVSLTNFGLNLSAGNDTLVNVIYDGKNMTVFVSLRDKDGVVSRRNQAFSESIDLSAYLPQNVFVGFSASTSSVTQLNCVKSWVFQGSDIGDGSNKLLWVYITAPLVTILLMSIAFLLLWKLIYRKKQLVDSYDNVEEEIKGSSMAPLKFRLKELKRATGNFNPKNKLGKGGFGTVYRGTLNNKEVAVKRISKKSTQGKQEFIAEVKTIGNLNHKHLVKLIGWCYESREFLLVYELMPNSSLDKYIFSDKKIGVEGSMSATMKWETRVSVIYGVAQALDYLHNGCKNRVLHRDIKASNIMLDSEFNAKLGDFGLARTILKSDQTHHSTKEIAGTPGYMAPESILTGRATVETDVYAFGVLVMEVVCGRKPGNQILDSDYSSGIANWLWELYGYGRILDGVDPKLEEEYQVEEVECMLLLGLGCCHPNPHHRPSMKTVLQVLTGEAAPPNVPTKRPNFVWPAMPPSFNASDCSLAGGQLAPFSDMDGR
ncbi:probable L-type lectin-domain containing receptor kinase S.5 [Tripterygium wilfordii]|uniref:probable L-type lectin-domain containing receptor kinase S.5 n=1 Tax=Tripterygium wilfordii TaxID=458696 RepID=UPI0018F81C8F|nr:probable L-type lectin-domain containing receptor kinase S.5 [Tripterygium wilfordii]XP_038697673.1 probable L-type lectin-domain containing receptor kinase S.5 [Tripterygium wilfordii]XP_038697674.1 probable L-type lectin-domain containing receptor kinase S.5 [Tripterygium wilfordii]XP_038697675.1 probable L-type lectin-domain containing receptor kinase S.5 [Tripterygium wilfordii]XP_038697676.1 probable L-type lectin-domain containing receptor kinase S.5 [Tripterygium wilfordii]XP_0386976